MEIFYPADCERLPRAVFNELQQQLNCNHENWENNEEWLDHEELPEHIQIVSETELILSELEL